MLNFTETQLFKSKISILTIPRENFWIFKSGVLEIIYHIIDSYETRSKSTQSDNDNYSSSDNETDNDNGSKEEESGMEIEDDGLFFHLAFTREEVTIFCSSKLIKRHFSKAIELDKESTVIGDEFFIIQVLNDGSNIGKKILELTQPLSLNNISLFFISNYFSDLVLVPIKDKTKALEILENPYEPSINEEAEIKTFELFKKNNIQPKIVLDSKLLLTGARSGDYVEVLKQTAEAISRLNVMKDFPRIFAITRTPTEEIGLLLPCEEKELNNLRYRKSTIMGSLQDYYYAIVVDLKMLPLDLKGVVSGIATKLLRLQVNEMSYLSLGKSGLVLVPDLFLDIVERGL